MARSLTANRHLHGATAEAERLGVSRSWLYTEARERRFPHVRLGGRILFDPDESDRFLEQRFLSVDDALAADGDSH